MRRFVLDEWIWADLQGQNGEEAQSESFGLLLAIFEKCDQMITVQGSPFLKKFYELAREARTGDKRREIVRTFKAQFLMNSEKLLIFQEGYLPDLPKEVASKIKEDDKYLVRVYCASKADLLVTTDNPLIEMLANSGINCQDRRSFLSNYMGNNQY